MRTIPNNFKKGGFDYQLLKRDGSFVIYSQSEKGKVYAYEVHQVRWKPRTEMPNGVIEEGEYLAGTEDWGIYAWTFIIFENALRKFEELRQKRGNKPNTT